MYKSKLLPYIMMVFLLLSMISPIATTHAAPLDNVLSTLAASTMTDQNSGGSGTGLLEKVFNLVFNKFLGPILNIFTNKTSTPSPVIGTPTSPGTLKGKIIVVDPGHGGSNPGAVANNTKEADNNLAVALKLRDKLVQAGAKVIMTRDTNRTVAPEGSSLGAELEARVNLAESNKADLFISIHTNSNPDTNITGAMTFYPSGKSATLATEVQKTLIMETGATDKGTSPATFYVLRNATMPSILVEMGFISNATEASQLKNDGYRTKMAQGIAKGIVSYSANH